MEPMAEKQKFTRIDTINEAEIHPKGLTGFDSYYPEVAMGLSSSENGTSIFAVHAGESTEAIDFCVIDEYSTETRWQLESAEDPDGNRLFIGVVPELAPGTRYGLRAHNRDNPSSSRHLLIDPYAKTTIQDESGQMYGVVSEVQAAREIKRPKVESKDRVIYETHLKGATALHPDVPPELRGTYLGFSHPTHIEYLKGLGVTTVEVLPIMQFVNEPHLEGLGKSNYWGYNPANFFSPHDKYANNPESSITELKAMVDALHDANLEVVLDVVYNHTADGGEPMGYENNSIVSLRGLDKNYYHTYEENGETKYHNYSGCGNAIDASGAPGHKLVIDSLRYWANEIGVDGFRFDLASTMIRDGRGHLDEKTSTFMKAVREDEDLRDLILIAEPWDMGPDGYARGKFAPNLQEQGEIEPKGPRWQEWSDTSRDVVRRWILGEANAGELAAVLADPHDTINFITAHDGFTLNDLVSYNHKHNEANGEDNRDGNNNNHSNNRGVEGPTDNPHIIGARRQAVRNMMLTLQMSAGTPMINGGDEYLRTQSGNNNAYCQDNETTWHDPKRAEQEKEMVGFTTETIALHKRSGVGSDSLKRNMGAIAFSPIGEKGIDWVNLWGQEMTHEDWAGRLLGRYTSGVVSGGESILFYSNGLPHDASVSLPTSLAMAGEYELLADTATGRIEQEGIGIVPEKFVVKAMSSVVLRRVSSRLPNSDEVTPSQASIIPDMRTKLSESLDA